MDERYRPVGGGSFFCPRTWARGYDRKQIDPSDGPGGSLNVALADRFESCVTRNEALKKLYVGNLPFETTEEELREIFEQHGPTASVRIITDRDTGRSRGFAFVEFESDANADSALQALDGKDMGGRALRVNEAQDKGGRGGGGGRGPRR